MSAAKIRVEWDVAGDALAAIEPTWDEVAAAAEALAAACNDAHNRTMLALSGDMSADDVVAHYASLAPPGGRPFLLLRNGALVGDADLRHIDHGRGQAELAILIGARADQGKGLGTRYAIMLHAFAFRTLGLERVYVTIVPANAASLRLFEKVGHRRDDSPAARAYTDDPTDVALSLARTDFERAHRLEGIRVLRRST
jgi:RimJ/RimL family protein N-acetyltransferase